MEFVPIPAGTFLMGSPEDEKCRYDNEGPQHLVSFSEHFYIGKYEVTQEQWQALMGSNPSHKEEGIGPNYPVNQISWNDCQKFIGKLNGLEQGNFRLPTEAEWEYACRAGSTTRYYFGEARDCGCRRADDCSLKDYAWYNVNADIKKHARLNVISHLLNMIPYEELTPEPFDMPDRQDDIGYVRPPFEDLTFIPEVYPRPEDLKG